jgi:hypothetical protein
MRDTLVFCDVRHGSYGHCRYFYTPRFAQNIRQYKVY